MNSEDELDADSVRLGSNAAASMLLLRVKEGRLGKRISITP